MRVFADFHHHALWESLRILFEERFGWELYRPTGMEWYEKQLWNFERGFPQAEGVAKQYLARWDDDVEMPDHWTRWDRKYPGQTMKMVTLDQFYDQDWDFVIATLDHNEPAYAHLANAKDARYGIEIGNQWGNHNYQLKPFVLSAVKPEQVPDWIDHVTVRQEFDTKSQFFYEPPNMADPWTVQSWVNCFPTAPTYQRFTTTAEMLPGVSFEVYGPYCEGKLDQYAFGDIEKVPEIARIMRTAGLGWHDKRWSDGYGHVIHNWFAIGRPPLVSMAYYDGREDGLRRMAADLMIPDGPGQTCIDIQGKGPVEIAEAIRKLTADEDRYWTVCENAAKRFREVVDFGAEADAAYFMLTGEHL